MPGTGTGCFELLPQCIKKPCPISNVSMPSRAWVVTARMSNILNFSWYFLCIPAIYRCILAYLSIFFNQLSEFLRCESPSTFLGTCLSHHSFIIFLIFFCRGQALFFHIYLISTWFMLWELRNSKDVSMPSRAYTSFLLSKGTVQEEAYAECQCPLGLIPHFYRSGAPATPRSIFTVSMPSRAYTSFLQGISSRN